MNNYPLKVAVIYLALGLLWLGITGWMVYDDQDIVHWTFQRPLKDILFIVVTAVVLYVVISYHYRHLRRNELEYSSLFRDNPYPMLVYDTETLQIMTTNNAFRERYGYNREDLSSLKLTDTVQPEDELAIIDFVKKVEEKSFSDSGIWRQKNKNGQSFYARVSSHATHFKGKKARIVMAIDTTEEEPVAQKEISRTQVHDLRKHLANMLSLCSLLNNEPENLAFHKELIPLLRQSCEELDLTIKRITDKPATSNNA